jgi:hypothetical protein
MVRISNWRFRSSSCHREKGLTVVIVGELHINGRAFPLVFLRGQMLARIANIRIAAQVAQPRTFGFCEEHGRFSSEQASILIQARTGHCHLNQYLSRVGIVEEAKCPYGTDDETVRHVLCVCPLWAVQRKTLQAVAGDRWGDVSYLLGGWGKRRDAKLGKLLDGEKDNWRPDLTVVKATV